MVELVKESKGRKESKGGLKEDEDKINGRLRKSDEEKRGEMKGKGRK